MNKKTVYIKKCCSCDKEFYSSDQRKLSCSNKCYDKWYRSKKSTKGKVEKICKSCNRSFLSFKYLKSIFCSSRCYGDNLSFRKKKNFKIEVSCKNCSKKFLVHQYRIGKVKFCSKLCFDDIRRKDDKCIKCGKNYRNANWDQSKYCSKECAGSAVHNRSANEIEIYNKLAETYHVSRYTINKEGKRIIPDIIIGNTIIEYNGDYWHCNPKKYSSDFFNFNLGMSASKKWEEDSNRRKILSNIGYRVKTIWEFDYKKDPDGVINDCIKILEERMILKFKKLNERAILPSYATKQSAGMDISACIEDSITLYPKDTVVIPTGLAMELPTGYEAQIRSRSGIAMNHAVVVLNAPGTIDSDYRGELKIILMNHSNKPFKIERGMRIAQIVISFLPRIHKVSFVNDLDETERGEGGFGSTGTEAVFGKDFKDYFTETAEERAQERKDWQEYYSTMGDKAFTVDDVKESLLKISKGEK